MVTGNNARATAQALQAARIIQAARVDEPLNENLATFLAALAIACSEPYTTTTGRVVAFGKALRSPGESKTITDGKMHIAPSPAQEIVARAQQAGLVAGDVLKRLGV